MSASANHERYVELSKQAVATTNALAGSINLMIAATQWGHWTQLAIAVLGQALVIAVNFYLSFKVVPKYGPRVEPIRAAFNACGCAALYQYLGWPLPVWLWLPFSALVFHEYGGRYSTAVCVIMCSVQSAAGLACGVPVVIPVTFIGLTIVCRIIASQRTAIIREMLESTARAHEDLKSEIAARERAELELRQAQKLEAIGRLAAGVAHEINTPMQYIGDSVSFVRDGIEELLAGDGEANDAVFLRENLPLAIGRIDDGVRRVSAIVRSMKQFARPAADALEPMDINMALADTLTITAHEYRLLAEVETQFAELPKIVCNGGEINQVFVNLIVNAAHAIADASRTDSAKGRITVTTRCEDGAALISIRDTGLGVPEAARAHIFEPFFTTKPVGRGSGQGLAISRAIIERHGGRIMFDTGVGSGTTFTVSLPLQRPPLRAAA